MKTFAELKKDFKLGRKVRTNYNYFGKNLGIVRPITKVQSNAIKLDNSYLYLPETAKLVEYEDNKFRFYEAGERDYNEVELKALEEWKKITETEEYQRQSYQDAMTDTSLTYWKQKVFWERKGMKYMFYEKQGGLERNHNTDKIRDTSIKGELLFEYEFVD